MLKVAVITNYFPISTHPWNGHSAYQTLRLLSRLCDVHVFYPEAVYPSFMRPANGKGSFDRAWNPPDVKATYIPYPAVPVLTRPFNGYTSAAKLMPFVAEYDPDIVLNYTVYPYGLAAVRVARALGIPAVLTAIGSDLNRMSDPICAMLTRQTLRRADFVTTVSHNLCTTARRLGAPPGSTRTKLNGCDTSVFFPRDRQQSRTELGLSQTDKIIVYVGRLDLRKGLLELIEAVANLRATQPDLMCYLIGDGAAKATLLEAIARHDVGDIVSIVPSCVSEKVAIWMGAADLVTLPSYNEGCPNVVIEAVSAGRPVVATKVGGIPELMNETCGRLVKVRDVPTLTKGLADVLDTHWDAQTISAKYSRSWQDVADDLHKIFVELVGRR
jgi:glycosyltransferase involved in cell wall biosynthesis